METLSRDEPYRSWLHQFALYSDSNTCRQVQQPLLAGRECQIVKCCAAKVGDQRGQRKQPLGAHPTLDPGRHRQPPRRSEPRRQQADVQRQTDNARLGQYAQKAIVVIQTADRL